MGCALSAAEQPVESSQATNLHHAAAAIASDHPSAAAHEDADELPEPEVEIGGAAAVDEQVGEPGPNKTARAAKPKPAMNPRQSSFIKRCQQQVDNGTSNISPENFMLHPTPPSASTSSSTQPAPFQFGHVRPVAVWVPEKLWPQLSNL